MDEKQEVCELEFSSHNIDIDLEALEKRRTSIIEKLSDGSSENGEVKASLHNELDKLTEQEKSLIALKERNAEKIKVLQENSPSSASGTVKGVVKQVITAPASAAMATAKSGLKSLATKTNPISKPINKSDVSDSGVEGVRLAYTGVRNGRNAIKTVGKSVKTTQRTIKTTGNAVKATGRIVYNTAAFTIRAGVRTVQVTGTVLSHVVASLLNPIVILCAGILVVLLMCAMLLVILMGGGGSASNSNKQAQSGAVGLVDVPAQYQDGLEFFRIAVENKRNGFYGLIDGLYYDYNDLPHSDLVYMVRTIPGTPQTIYNTSFAVDSQKGTLKSAWRLSLTAPQAIAIAYVCLEKAANAANGTENGIYEVTFTQETFNSIVNKCAAFSDTTYDNQQCPNHNCTKYVEYVENPAYAPALAATNQAADAYNDWLTVANAMYQNSLLSGYAKSAQWSSYVVPLINNWTEKYKRTPSRSNNGQDFLSVLGSEYEAALAVLNATPSYTEVVTYICNLEHRLHSIGLNFYTAEDVMNALGFTETEKEWVKLTELGFTNNPNIP